MACTLHRKGGLSKARFTFQATEKRPGGLLAGRSGGNRGGGGTFGRQGIKQAEFQLL